MGGGLAPSTRPLFKIDHPPADPPQAGSTTGDFGELFFSFFFLFFLFFYLKFLQLLKFYAKTRNELNGVAIGCYPYNGKQRKIRWLHPFTTTSVFAVEPHRYRERFSFFFWGGGNSLICSTMSEQSALSQLNAKRVAKESHIGWNYRTPIIA